MAQTYTHYDNLKVARNAPPEVISAAYRALSQRFHPDSNVGNTEAARSMAIINASYEVLSDPDKRREHDQWIKEVEAAGGYVKMDTGQAVHRPTPTPDSIAPPVLSWLVLFNAARWLIVLGLSFVVLWIIWIIGGSIDFFGGKSTPPPGPVPDYIVSPNPAPAPSVPSQVPHNPNPAPTPSANARPSTAPNGHPWPVSAGYVTGYPLLQTDGLSTVTVDNSRNDSDVFVKLVSLAGPQAYPVRQFYIPKFGSFTVRNVTAGRYDIRYRDLTTGGLSRSEALTLQEIPTYGSTQFSNLTITLYKVLNGNMQTYGLSENEF